MPRRLAILLVALTALLTAACNDCSGVPFMGPSRGEWFGNCGANEDCVTGARCMTSGAVDRRGMKCVGGRMCTLPCQTNQECVMATGIDTAFCAVADGVCSPDRLLGCRR